MAQPAKMRIGIDFDNTLVTYDQVFLAAAKRAGLVEASFSGSKEAVRDAIRALPDGEVAWQKLQGFVYGAGIGGAALFEGVDQFLRQCREAGCTVLIVSHKTEYNAHDEAKVNLREAARAFMTANGFFHAGGFAIAPEHVFFEPTRAAKLDRIGAVGCTHFIDDLPEVIDDPAFPAEVTPILFTNGGTATSTRGKALSHWRDIAAAVLA